MEIVAVTFLCGCCCGATLIGAAVLWITMRAGWGMLNRARRILP